MRTNLTATQVPAAPVARAAGKPRLSMAMRQLEGGTGPGRTALGVSDGGRACASLGRAWLTWLLKVGEAGRVVASICKALCAVTTARCDSGVER